MILVTGGAGFIGSNFVLDWLENPIPERTVVECGVVDCAVRGAVVAPTRVRPAHALVLDARDLVTDLVDREVERGHQRKVDPYRVADRLFSGVLEDAREEGREEAALAEEDGPAGLTEERMA